MHKLENAWAVLSDRYGAQWTRDHGRHWNGQQWLEDCGDLDARQIDHGLELDRQRIARLVERGQAAFPPDSATFRALCLQAPKPRQAPEPERPRNPHVRTLWAAYRQRYGLEQQTMTDEQISQVLDGADLEAMHAEVRAVQRQNGLPNAAEWPWRVDRSSGKGITYTGRRRAREQAQGAEHATQ